MTRPESNGESPRVSGDPKTAGHASTSPRRTLNYDRYGSYVSADESPLEFTVKAIVLG